MEKGCPPDSYVSEKSTGASYAVERTDVRQPGSAITVLSETPREDQELVAKQIKRTLSLAKAIIILAIISIPLAVVALILNTVIVASGYTVYTYDQYSNEQGPKASFYPGMWYGSMNILAGLVLIFYCRKVMTQSRHNFRYTLLNKAPRSCGSVMSALYGAMAVCGIIAMGLSLATRGILLSGNDGLDCTFTYHSFSKTCVCSEKFEVIGVKSCDFATGPLAHLYISIVAFAVPLIIINGVISILLSGMLCFCAVLKNGYGEAPNINRQALPTTVIITDFANEAPQQGKRAIVMSP